MPDITLPNDVSADTTTVAANIKDNLYEPNSVPDTFEVINGRLDYDNIDAAAFPLTRNEARRGSFVVGSTRGANANIDYFDDFFQGAWTFTTLADLADRMEPISGAANTFYVPWNTCKGVYLSWHVSMVVDAGYFWDLSALDRVDSGGTPTTTTGAIPYYLFDGSGQNALMLYVDGTPTWATLRKVSDGGNSMAPSFDAASASQADQFEPDSRHWHGHFVIDFINKSDTETSGTALDNATVKGWHTAEIRVAHKAKGVRFKTRRMTAIPFR